MVLLGSVAEGQAAVEAVTPTDTVRDSNEAILAILSEHDPLDSEGEGRVYVVMDGVTDFGIMSETAVLPACEAEAIPIEKCDEWKTVFADLLRIRSIKGVGRYRADRFDYLSEEIDGERAVVFTLAHYDGDEVTLDYEMAQREGGWFIVNYIVDDVDTVRSWSRRFMRLLRDETVDDVIQRLRVRIEELREET